MDGSSVHPSGGGWGSDSEKVAKSIAFQSFAGWSVGLAAGVVFVLSPGTDRQPSTFYYLTVGACGHHCSFAGTKKRRYDGVFNLTAARGPSNIRIPSPHTMGRGAAVVDL